MLHGRRILLIISGGIAAYKALDLIRRLRERGARVRCILTAGAQQFITPLSAAALSGEKAYSDLFSLTDESEMGHLRLAQESDLLVVAPASADILAKMAGGLADDLAATALLATDKPILVAPAMNFRMWEHKATQENLARLASRGVKQVGPNAGPLAENESGMGRMAEPLEIVAAIEKIFVADAALSGRRALVTSGPTQEPIDPVRYIANRSSGRQGHAIAAALARLGADCVLVSGPTNEPDPPGVKVVRVETAREMLAACEAALPADIAICAAAVADWRAEAATSKLKKKAGTVPALKLVENPDILATLSKAGNRRPKLVVGFAAETENVVANAQAKRAKKGCDWILANDVSPASGVFGGESNTIHLVNESGVEDWPAMTKRDVGDRLARRIATFFAAKAAAE
ncbi:MAG TPA: bifunctional phosphopantothenoylcysteine decarboxylase/phosphopantothenate--cysteine ligase CoaBC [Stellaceae bacterium]|jgi:phosphopantothenoylcysteine decarboxylase / phosphopantothenate---cysteine ligase|nr:bifunctional phosphopantothenoylcysteine decarboxylase/phosphopantothenate--cysteine ligase CoaBC [Stellaceae bacterium]